MGDLQLWMHLRDGRPPEWDKFCVGCDISMGLSKTPSAASIANQTTWEKVGLLATPRLSPERFAEEVVNLCKWLNDAYLIWELNGPGLQFGKRVIELGYLNVYYRTSEGTLSRKVSDSPGWMSSRDNRRLLFGDYCAGLSSGRFVNHDEHGLKECRHFVLNKTGEIVNSVQNNTGDRYGAGSNHADVATADALVYKALTEVAVRPAADEAKEKPSDQSFEGRRIARAAAKEQEGSW